MESCRHCTPIPGYHFNNELKRIFQTFTARRGHKTKWKELAWSLENLISTFLPMQLCSSESSANLLLKMWQAGKSDFRLILFSYSGTILRALNFFERIRSWVWSPDAYGWFWTSDLNFWMFRQTEHCLEELFLFVWILKIWKFRQTERAPQCCFLFVWTFLFSERM